MGKGHSLICVSVVRAPGGERWSLVTRCAQMVAGPIGSTVGGLRSALAGCQAEMLDLTFPPSRGLLRVQAGEMQG